MEGGGESWWGGGRRCEEVAVKNLLTLQGKQTRSDDSWMLTVCFHFKFCFGFVFAFLVVVGGFFWGVRVGGGVLF